MNIYEKPPGGPGMNQAPHSKTLAHVGACHHSVVAPLFPASALAQSSTSSPAEAIALEQQGKLEEAAKVWQEVVQRNRRDAAAFASLGVDLSRLQNYPEAAAADKKALALDSKLAGIQRDLGLAELKQGHFAAAIAPFTAALAEQPGSTQARTLLGLSYYGAGRFS